ncbi:MULTISPECIES: hypothetical protein [Bradyrhizobium]|uniref:Uncharacterized protein n=1 Tax=Bradyrhizobium brasilense TaxID=1419277 RepID=A0ABY8JKI2_9BRAD|nr:MULTISPECIES: hypothetical protein [Bradyrhizobium]MCA6104298.1 hypothetical protein [Bradyrhizobium australafricanum]MCC8975243.1 hypothetical protein [Bradyrhizobium brasilense]WFU65329.1 hypothetical protein QA636_07275 [Bradyrhizobium brasilense]
MHLMAQHVLDGVARRTRLTAPDFIFRECVRFIPYHIQFHDRRISALLSLTSAQHLVGMKRARTIEIHSRGPRFAASAQIDPALIKFAEALAIADARRDHLFESERLMKNHLDAAGDKRISSGIRDETRSDLCSVLDRASKRKID